MRPLSHQDRVAAFKAATRALIHWHGEALEKGVSDEQLAELLEHSMGIFGGRGGPGEVSIAYQGAGLKIWASWDWPNHVTDKPIFAGTQTVKMAREVYGIADPSDRQGSLF